MALSSRPSLVAALVAFLRASSIPLGAAGLGLGVASTIVLTGPSAEAKSSYESMYGFDRTWTAALRLVRVDLGFPITEKDPANGYLIFEYHSVESGKKTSVGSMEFVRGREGAVRVSVQLPAMPSYHEQVMIDALVRKMRSEYGDAPAPKKDPPPAPPPSDAGADGGSLFHEP